MEKENSTPHTASAQSAAQPETLSAVPEPTPHSPGDSAAGDMAGEDVQDWKKKADERDAYRNELLRAKAELDNFQKRVRRERPAWEDQAVRRFLRDLLPVSDNLERALTHTAGAGLDPSSKLEEGVRLTFQILCRVLVDHGVEEIPAQGEVFNPELHEAVAEVEVADHPTGRIVEVLEKGYRHKDAVLRPSRVNVARNTGNVKQAVDPTNAANKDSKKNT